MSRAGLRGACSSYVPPGSSAEFFTACGGTAQSMGMSATGIRDLRDRACGRRSHWYGILASLTAALAIALFIALPWVDQRFVWCEWLGVAVALLMVDRLRGWWGEFLTLAAATTSIAIAFHWTPAVLAYSMNADYEIGVLIAAPIVLWDGMRLALPFWIVGRLEHDPLRAWLPAGMTAAAIEAVAPAIFPWKLGYSQVNWPHLIQSVDLFGPESSTFMLFAHAGAIVWLVHLVSWVVGGHVSPKWRDVTRAPGGGLVLLVCGLNAAYGVFAIMYWSQENISAPALRMAIVQSNPEEADGIDSLRMLTEKACSGPGRMPDLICWPECSGGTYDASLKSLSDSSLVHAASRGPHRGMRPLEKPVCPLLFGGKIYTGHAENPRTLYQSAILIDPSETILGCYHKRHLMPFGEYVPGSDLYPNICVHFPMQDDFTAGTEARVLTWDQGPRLGVMLCYEDMIPGAARSLVRESANVLVSLINGSAFTAPLTLSQHRLLSQLRAVECRRSLVRCAATGETCVISPTGEVTASLPLHGRGVLVADVPLLESTTVACRVGSAFPLACGAATVALAFRKRLVFC